MLAAAERKLGASDVSQSSTEALPEWQEDEDRFWREVDREYEAKSEAAEAFQTRLNRPEAELSTDEGNAAWLLREARRERDRYRDRYHVRKRMDKQRNGAGGGFAVTAPDLPAPAVTITGMFNGYAGQDGSKPETVRQWRSIINHLVAFLGHDDAKAVALSDLARWREHLRTEAVKGGKARSAKTINDSYLAAANAVLAYGVNQLLIPANPASDLAKVRAPKAPKLREKDFTKAERKIILQAALVAGSGNLSPERALARRWVPWLCAYTGARVNEVTQLRKADVREIEGVWTVRITPEAGGVKTNEARTVPLHEHLIEQGFIEALKGKPDGPLFYKPDPAATSPRGQHKQVGTFLAAWVRDLGVTDPAIRPNHGWRHTFKTICLEAEVEERAADYIQGHASKGQGRKYGANSISALAAQLAKFPRFEVAEANDKGR